MPKIRCVWGPSEPMRDGSLVIWRFVGVDENGVRAWHLVFTPKERTFSAHSVRPNTDQQTKQQVLDLREAKVPTFIRGRVVDALRSRLRPEDFAKVIAFSLAGR